MDKVKLKAELLKLIDNAPESTLEEVYKILLEVSSKHPDQLKLSHNLNKILSEDRELLKKLAQ